MRRFVRIGTSVARGRLLLCMVCVWWEEAMVGGFVSFHRGQPPAYVAHV